MPKDIQRENSALAADHLVKSLRILAKVVLPDPKRHLEVCWGQWAGHAHLPLSVFVCGGGGGGVGLTHTETKRGRLWTGLRTEVWGQQETAKRPPQQPAQPPIRQLMGAADAQTAHPATCSTAPAHQTTGLRERGNDTSKSTGRSGRQNAATRRNMRTEERVTVQGPVKKQQRDGMSHRGAHCATRSPQTADG